MNVRFLKSVLALIALFLALPATALDLTVTQFGQAMFGAPFAVAKVKCGYQNRGTPCDD